MIKLQNTLASARRARTDTLLCFAISSHKYSGAEPLNALWVKIEILTMITSNCVANAALLTQG